MSLHSYDWISSSRSTDEGQRFDNDDKFDEESNFHNAFPSLPGFTPSNMSRPPSAKNQSLSFVNGYMMVRSPLSARPPSRQPKHVKFGDRPMTAPVGIAKEVLNPTDVIGRYSFARKKADRENCNIELPYCPSSKLPPFLEHDRRVLLFNAYYEEKIDQSAIEDKRVHRCQIYFYVEDGTMEIIQTKQENSGIPQGVFLRRSKVKKPTERTSGYDGCDCYYQIDDLKIGGNITIYGRIFHIVSCNESTRNYVLEVHGWNEKDVQSVPLPRDQFTEIYKEKMRRESGVPGVDRSRKMHELKEVMESMLGKQKSIADRGMFLECGTDALCFQVVWDDRGRLYGDVQYFRLFYYLADDTVEILRVKGKNDGRDNFTKLLKRSKLPKNEGVSMAPDYYTWKDITIGETINVFGRKMFIARCDAFTRQHYLSNGINLHDDMPLQKGEKKVDIKRPIPPYNGFGSEEDSLRSCTGSLNPPPAKKDLAKMRDKSGEVLRFNAQFVTDKIEDVDRRFVIQFFMEDDTIAIRELPVHNSGVMGGNFLRRSTIKQANGVFYAAKDMYVGNIVDIVGRRFLLLDSDENSYRLMECDDKTFPYSNFSRLHSMLASKVDGIKTYFVTNYDGNGALDLDGLAKCCESIGLKFNKQELVTIWRKLDRKGKGQVAFRKLLTLASEDTFGPQK